MITPFNRNIVPNLDQSVQQKKQKKQMFLYPDRKTNQRKNLLILEAKFKGIEKQTHEKKRANTALVKMFHFILRIG